MKIFPQLKELENHISHYWIVKDSNELFSTASKVYGYPGIRPEIIFILKGWLRFTYLGKRYKTDKSILASHIKGNFLFDAKDLEQFIIVQFKPRSISSLLPFVKSSSEQLMQNSICYLNDIFGEEVRKLQSQLLDNDSSSSRDILDAYFLKKMDKNFYGFITEMLYNLPLNEGIPSILKKTGYSRSSLERYVKKETGLTPKAYLSLKKYKTAVEEIHFNQNPDWQYYVEKYNYTDQSHFIKTVKRYTGFTPSQLIKTPNLISYRPNYY